MLTVLYEDKGGQRNEFGLHRFVCQLAIDLGGWNCSVFDIDGKEIQGVPLKGNGNLLKRCRRDLAKLARKSRRVFAVYDQDKAPRLVHLEGRPCRPLLAEKLAEGCEPPGVLEIVLIGQNVESLIEAIRNSGAAPHISASLFEKALGKELSARDSVFIQCAASTAREQRQELLRQLPDVRRLVEKIVQYQSPGS